MLYIVVRGLWCNIVVLNVHAPSEEKSDDSKEGFYEELGQVLIIFTLKKNENHQLGTGFFVHHRIVSAVK